jgi:hypothetical protein
VACTSTIPQIWQNISVQTLKSYMVDTTCTCLNQRTFAYVAKPPMKSAVLFGWEDRRWNRWRLDEKEKNWDHMSSSSSVFLDIARWVFSLRHKSPAWQGQRSVQDRLCSKQMHPFMNTDFPLQVQTRSCKKSVFSFSSSLHLFHRIKLLLSKLWSQIKQSFISNIVTINSR